MRTSAWFRLTAVVFTAAVVLASTACASSRKGAFSSATAAAVPRSTSAPSNEHSDKAEDWPMFGHDPSRSGDAASETAISLGNIESVHRRWVANLDAPADSAPILISNVIVSGKKLNVLFVTSRRGTTYAIVADRGSLLWTHSTSGPNITNSMPAADPSRQWVYAPGVDGFVHQLSASTGAESMHGGFPVRITWMPEVEKDAAALNVANGYLYAVTSGYNGDFGHYDGHVVTVQLNTGKVRVFNSLCSDIAQLLGASGGPSCPQTKSGIWARGGAVVDPDPSMHGRIYVATGNGSFTANSGGYDYGDSVLALSADGAKLEDYYTPADYADLESGDVDLGSTAPVMLPRQDKSRTPLLALQGGKDGVLRLLNREHLGGVAGEVSELDFGSALFSAPAVARDRIGQTWVYVGTDSSVTALQIATDSAGKSSLRKAWSSDVGGTSPIVADGIVYAETDNAVNALDARSGKVVWSTTQPSAGGTIGSTHWESPIVVNGWIYASDQAGALTAYSLSH
jgi:outer membrane protein assembly factor BamB